MGSQAGLLVKILTLHSTHAPSRGKLACLAYPKSGSESAWDCVDRGDSDPLFAVSERKRQNLI